MIEEIVDYALTIIQGLVAHPDMVKIDPIDSEERTTLFVSVHESDFGTLIGKNGETITALRRIVLVNSRMHGLPGVFVEATE